MKPETIRLSPDVHKALVDLARTDDRWRKANLDDMVNMIIREALHNDEHRGDRSNYRARILAAASAAIRSQSNVADAIEKELQDEFYLVDQCLAMVDPSQPEFTGSCPICKADVSQDSDETHRDECALAEVIVKQQPHDCFAHDCKPCVEKDDAGRIHTKSKCECKEVGT